MTRPVFFSLVAFIGVSVSVLTITALALSVAGPEKLSPRPGTAQHGSVVQHGWDQGYLRPTRSGVRDGVLWACNNESDFRWVKSEGYYGQGRYASIRDFSDNGKCESNWVGRNMHNHRLIEENNGKTGWSVHDE